MQEIPPSVEMSPSGELPSNFPYHLMTMTHAHLNDIQNTLEQAQACLLGDTPEVGTHEEARQDTLDKIKSALNNHVPSLRIRLK